MCETNIAVIGHIDHGKSTLIGRMLYESGHVSDERLSSIKEKDGINFANLLDSFVEEQSEGKTINSMRVSMRVHDREFIFFDVPGHAEFVDQMAMSTSRVQRALLVVDVNEGIREQTIHHLNIAQLFGVNDVVVVINKMDAVDFSEKRYNSLKKEVERICTETSLVVHACIPVSAKDGINIFHGSETCSWYDDPALADVLYNIKDVRKESDDKLIFSIQDTFDIDDQKYAVGKTIPSAKDLTLPVKLYDLKNTREHTVLHVLNTDQEQVRKIDAGDSVSLVVSGADKVGRGIILAKNREDVSCANRIIARVLWLSEKEFSDQQDFSFRLSVQDVSCTFSLEKKVYGDLKKNISRGDIAICEISCREDVVFTSFAQFATLGIATISDADGVVAIAVL